jgi:hypothetical protein
MYKEVFILIGFNQIKPEIAGHQFGNSQKGDNK